MSTRFLAIYSSLVFFVCFGVKNQWVFSNIAEKEYYVKELSQTRICQIDSTCIAESKKVSEDKKHLSFVRSLGPWIMAGNVMFNTGVQKYCIVVDGRDGKEYSNVGYPIFSPDSKRVAYKTQIDNKWCVVVDENEGKLYDGISDIVFSPDSKRIAYMAKIDDKWCVVLDNKDEKYYDSVGEIIFSPDSRRIAYGVKSGNKQYVILDGEAQKQYEKVGGLTFSPDSKQIAYQAQADNRWCIVLNGKEGKQYDEGGIITFSPDSIRTAYWIKTYNKWCVVSDGKEGKQYDEVGSVITFSPNSRRIAYRVQINNKQCVVLDNGEEEKYDGVASITFSPDSNRVAYVAEIDKKWCVVLDGKMGNNMYEEVGSITFSPDSKHVVYFACNGKETFLVVNEREISKPYYTIISGGIVFDSNDRFHYMAMFIDNSIYLVEESIVLKTQSTVSKLETDKETGPMLKKEIGPMTEDQMRDFLHDEFFEKFFSKGSYKNKEILSGKKQISGEQLEFARSLGITGIMETNDGLLISEIQPGSPADQDLNEGDLIEEVNREKIANVKEFKQALGKAEKDKDILLLIKSGKHTRFAIIKRK